ncbi:MAG: META domain-containing protein [Methanomicrobiaceae archaeon]|nr:META domain-containing protein [Methanomicrobiaceae archaeon]
MVVCEEARLPTLILILLSFSAVLSTGCISPPSDTDVSGTAWELVSYRNETGMQNVIVGTSITAIFGEDGSLSGSAGCNHYSGSYAALEHAFTVSEIAWTEMYCLTPEGAMRQETEYLAALQSAAQFDVSSQELMMAGEDGTVLLLFDAQK